MALSRLARKSARSVSAFTKVTKSEVNSPCEFDAGDSTEVTGVIRVAMRSMLQVAMRLSVMIEKEVLRSTVSVL